MLILHTEKMHPILKAFLHKLKFRLKGKYTGMQRMIGSYKKNFGITRNSHTLKVIYNVKKNYFVFLTFSNIK